MLCAIQIDVLTFFSFFHAMENVYNNFDFCPFLFVFKLRAHTGQTDERTDGRARGVMRPIGGPHNDASSRNTRLIVIKKS